MKNANFRKIVGFYSDYPVFRTEGRKRGVEEVRDRIKGYVGEPPTINQSPNLRSALFNKKKWRTPCSLFFRGFFSPDLESSARFGNIRVRVCKIKRYQNSEFPIPTKTNSNFDP